MKLINENIYLDGRGDISHLLKRPLHELPSLPSFIILTAFFCKVNTILLDELPHKLFHISLQSENRQSKLI
jgi:hypothetical protein